MDKEWATLNKLFNPAEADIIRSRLEAAGFTVTLKNLDAALVTEGYTMATGGIWVQVRSAEESEARQFLETFREGPSEASE